MVRKKKKRTSGRFMRKYSVLPACGVVAAVFFIVLLIGSLEEEPITNEQILAKKEWQEEELVETMVRVNMSRKNRGTNPEIIRHLRKQVMKLPKDKRREVTRKTVKRSLEKLQEGWRDLEPEVRNKLILAMRKQVAQTRKRLQNLDKDKKAKMRQTVNDKENRKWMNEMQTKTLNNLPPDLRREIAPLAKEWIKTIETL